jgi:hypothetical protein
MIVFGGGAIDCIVHNVSKTGAAFDVTSPVGIPEQFTLVIPGDGLNVGCRIIWRLGLSIGVKFDIGARGIAGGARDTESNREKHNGSERGASRFPAVRWLTLSVSRHRTTTPRPTPRQNRNHKAGSRRSRVKSGARLFIDGRLIRADPAIDLPPRARRARRFRGRSSVPT